MNNVVYNFEAITRIMRECINRELTSEGLLSDVENFIPVYYHDSTVEEPVIWMTSHPSRAEGNSDLSQTMDIITPFEFACAVYDTDTETSELASQNLATRVILAVTRNFLHVQKELYDKRIMKNIGLETFYPVGEVTIRGKSDKLPATAVVLNVTHTVNWVYCCNKL